MKAPLNVKTITIAGRCGAAQGRLVVTRDEARREVTLCIPTTDYIDLNRDGWDALQQALSFPPLPADKP